MPLYKVKVYDAGGVQKNLRREAQNEDELLRALSLEGFVPVSVEAEKSKQSRRSVKLLSLQDQHIFCTMLSAFLKSGLSLTEVLRLLERQTRDKKLRAVYSSLRESVEAGHSLAHSMTTQEVFRSSLIGMVESGERSSSLPDVLERAGALLQGEISLRRRIQSALTYPVLMLIVGAGVVAFLIAYVVPQLTGIVIDSGGTLPFATRALLFMSSAIKNLALPTLLAGLAAYAYFRKKRLRVSIPLFKEIRTHLSVSLIFSQLSTLVRSGVPLVQALEMTAPIDSKKGRIPAIAEDVRKGYRFSQSLERDGSFPEDVVAIVGIGEVGGNLPDCMDRIAANSWEFAQASMQKWSSLAEPLIILAMGVIVGFVVVAVLLPIFSLSSLVT